MGTCGRTCCLPFPARASGAGGSQLLRGAVFAASCGIGPLRREEPDVAGRGGLLGSVPGLAGRAKFRDE